MKEPLRRRASAAKCVQRRAYRGTRLLLWRHRIRRVRLSGNSNVPGRWRSQMGVYRCNWCRGVIRLKRPKMHLAPGASREAKDDTLSATQKAPGERVNLLLFLRCGFSHHQLGNSNGIALHISCQADTMSRVLHQVRVILIGDLVDFPAGDKDKLGAGLDTAQRAIMSRFDVLMFSHHLLVTGTAVAVADCAGHRHASRGCQRGKPDKQSRATQSP